MFPFIRGLASLSSSQKSLLAQITDNSFLVGGAVRDAILSIESKDKDHLVVGVTVEQMLLAGFIQVGKDFPVFLHPKTKEEYALARTEKKQGHGYTGFVCYASPDVTIEEDLLRRDLTVNAMARSSANELIDPYQGQEDLNKRLLRHVSPAFIEDPLRVLRVARFASRFHDFGFTVADETIAIMSKISASGELLKLSAERIWQETERALSQKHPQIYFEVLRHCGALSILFPAIDKLWDIPNPEQWHPEICSGVHTMMALEQSALLSPKTAVRFAALCHDLGKGLTPENKWPSHHGHEKSGLPIVEALCDAIRVPNDHRKLALKVCEYHLHCHKAFQLKASTLLRMLNNLDVWRNPAQYDDFLLACKADFLGRLGFENKAYPQEKFLRDVMQAASAVNAKAYVSQGLKGLEIKTAMENGRLQAIKKVIQQYSE